VYSRWGSTLDPADTPQRGQRLVLVTIYKSQFTAVSHVGPRILDTSPGRKAHASWGTDWNADAAKPRRAGASWVSVFTSIRKLEVRWLSVAQQQMVEIARAMSRVAKLIIMDEPTRPPQQP